MRGPDDLEFQNLNGIWNRLFHYYGDSNEHLPRLRETEALNRAPYAMNIGRMRGYMSMIEKPTVVDVLFVEFLDSIAEQFYDPL
jgi:hypothetical protein